MDLKDKIEQWRTRPHSWSQHNLFRDYDKEEWFSKYILCIPTPKNKRMKFGSAVGKRIETDPAYIPKLPRQKGMEHVIEASINDINLIGILDSFGDNIIEEYKTSGPTGWSQDKVDKHDQLTFYCLLLMLSQNIEPEKLTINLHHMHTLENGDFTITFAKPFKLDTYVTTRTTERCLKFGAEIINIRMEMEEYIKNKLSTCA